MAQLQELKRVKNAVLYTDGTNKLIRIDNVRLSFPKVARPEPEEDDEGNPRIDPKTGKQKLTFSASFMLPKDTHKAAQELCTEVNKELLAANKDSNGKPAAVAADKKYLVDGNNGTREEYLEHFVVTARETKRPACRDRKGEVILEIEQIEETFFAGAIVNVMIRPWFFGGKAKGSSKTYPKRLSAGLAGLQFVKDDGTRFGAGSIDTEGAWDNLGGDGDDGMGDAPAAPVDDEDEL